jgi:GNAT superfamily N-acetyltransferase
MAAGVEIVDLSASELATYAALSIAFRVDSRMARDPGAPAPDALVEVPVVPPFVKDYDTLAGMSPLEWPSRYAMERWGLLVARMEGRVVGGAAVAPGAEVMPEHAVEVGTAVLWDLRVAPERRGRGVGSALFRAAERWVRAQGYRALLVETQDVNVAACRLYARMGCRLVSYDEQGYDTMPGEARLIWRASAIDA